MEYDLRHDLKVDVTKTYQTSLGLLNILTAFIKSIETRKILLSVLALTR